MFLNQEISRIGSKRGLIRFAKLTLLQKAYLLVERLTRPIPIPRAHQLPRWLSASEGAGVDYLLVIDAPLTDQALFSLRRYPSERGVPPAMLVDTAEAVMAAQWLSLLRLLPFPSKTSFKVERHAHEKVSELFRSSSEIYGVSQEPFHPTWAEALKPWESFPPGTLRWLEKEMLQSVALEKIASAAFGRAGMKTREGKGTPSSKSLNRKRGGAKNFTFREKPLLGDHGLLQLAFQPICLGWMKP